MYEMEIDACLRSSSRVATTLSGFVGDKYEGSPGERAALVWLMNRLALMDRSLASGLEAPPRQHIANLRTESKHRIGMWKRSVKDWACEP